ncbi:unnamed protein product [Musa hybrid cultivar]
MIVSLDFSSSCDCSLFRWGPRKWRRLDAGFSSFRFLYVSVSKWRRIDVRFSWVRFLYVSVSKWRRIDVRFSSFRFLSVSFWRDLVTSSSLFVGVQESGEGSMWGFLRRSICFVSESWNYPDAGEQIPGVLPSDSK